MIILVTRKWFTATSTVSEVTFDGTFMGYVLEDTDRGLDVSMPLGEIVTRKIHSITAIPSGRYEMAITFSDRFQKFLPLLLNVPGYAGIRWHNGNTAADSDGCLLVGLTHSPNFVGSSREALAQWLPILQKAAKTGKIVVTIQRDKQAWQKFQIDKQVVVAVA